jgi:uncharacterized protein YndB with AHSA1/START domain
MKDLIAELERARRSVELGTSHGHVVELRRTYAASADDVWDACTNAERIPRWFLPITGDLRLGGRFQLQGNAGGEVKECEPPRRLAVTWEFGGQSSLVAVELAALSDDETALTLRHAVANDEHWGTYGPGAVGVGWEGAVMGLGWHLESGASRPPGDGSELMASDAGREFMRRSAAEWGDAHAASGADASVAGDAAARTSAAYVPEPV